MVHLVVILVLFVFGLVAVDAAMVFVVVQVMTNNTQKADTPVPFDLSWSTAKVDWIRRKVACVLLATWLRKFAPRSVEAYVLVSTGALLGMYWWSSTSWSPHGIAAVLVAAFVVYRLAEMLMAGIELVARELSLDGRTAASVAVIYLIQTLLCFTILAQHFGKFLDDRDRIPDGPAGYLFMIWGYVSTGGSTFTPSGLTATVIAMSAGAYSLLLLGVFLAYAVSNLRD
jgi:hypothetical protein